MLSLNDEFSSLEAARKAILAYTVERGESFSVSKADRKRYIVVCRDSSCQFRIRASVLKDSIRITILVSHSCSPFTHQNFRLGHSVAFLADHHREAIADNRELAPGQIQSNERLQHGNTIKYHQAYRVREALRKEIEGNEADSFLKIPGLVKILEDLDGEHRMAVQTDSDDRFLRCYMAPATTRIAFELCRKFIALDGTHTTSRYRMTLLIACVLDANDEILPIAWALVDIENGENWSWFLTHLKDDFWGIEEIGVVFMSDRDKGLQQALEIAFPDGCIAYCCQHMADNIQKDYGLACRQLFWTAAYASTEDKFNMALEKIGEQKSSAKRYLRKIPAKKWATYAFPISRYGHLTSNIVESVNSSWKDIRALPPLRILTTIWATVMRTVYERSKKPQSSERITDAAKKRLDEQYSLSRRYRVYSAQAGIAQVFIPDGASHIVNLRERTCSCNEFKEYRIPCRHAIAVCLHQAKDPYDYVDTSYSISTYRLTYEHGIHPLQEDILQEFEESQAPLLAKHRGRPKKKRYRRGQNGKRRFICSHCGQDGHNRRTCSNAAIE